MTLVSTNRSLFPSFSSLFDDVLNTELSQNLSSRNSTLPKVNIREDENGYHVEMAVPGMRKNDFNIQLDNNLLTISSEKKEEHENGQVKYTRKEFSYRTFQRRFTLPDTANGEKIEAAYENGILTISIPKKEEAKPKPPKSIKIS